MKTKSFSKKHLKLAMVLMLAIVMFIAGCGNNDSSNSNGNGGSQDSNENSASGTDSGDEGLTYLGNDVSQPVELIWYLPASVSPQDLNLVQDAVNVRVKEQINATVKLMLIPFGDYPQKMNTIVASGEAADIIWAAGWSFNFIQNVARGAFAPLDDMIEKYAPDIFTQMPAYMREGVKVDGATYAIPNYQAVFTNPGYVVLKDYIDKYGLDPASVKKLEDMEPFFSQIVAAEKDVVPFGLGKSGFLSEMTRIYNMESIMTNIGAIKEDDPGKVLNWVDMPEYEQYLDLVRNWYQKGYINQDAPLAQSNFDLAMTGKMISQFNVGLFPGGESESGNKMGGKQVQYIPLSTPTVRTSNIHATVNTISQNSKQKERALMLLNLVNTDSELFNILAFGIKDKHHTINADGTVKILPDGGYALSSGWLFGNVFNGYELEGTKGQQAEVKKINEAASPSPIIGFSFQGEAVTSQIANVNNVISQYQPALDTGSIDKSEKLEEYRTKLKQAGIDDIIAEMQKQLDAFRAGQ